MSGIHVVGETLISFKCPLTSTPQTQQGGFSEGVQSPMVVMDLKTLLQASRVGMGGQDGEAAVGPLRNLLGGSVLLQCGTSPSPQQMQNSTLQGQALAPETKRF